ncbi:cytochrome P450 [Streptomyces sp. NPDC088785]|uniref:cytochrome P450 family protein n=1 Tax=Streptomyces sp. NPDC088785 TaxID=3365897 RepID=UPI003822C44C
MPSTSPRDDAAAPGHDPAHAPFPEYAALRARGPVHRVVVPGSGPSWLVVSRDAARRALADPRLSNDIRHSATWTDDGGHALGRNMLQSDAPHHTRLRKLVAGHFTAGRIRSLRPRIEALADGLLRDLPDEGVVDAVERYALPLPVAVICELLGVPQDARDAFHAWSRELVLPTSEEAAAAAGAHLTGLIGELVDRKTAAPDGTLLSELAAAGRDGVLSADELLGMVFLLLVAGHETTVNLISAALFSLLAEPGLAARVRADPSLTAAVVEESLRFHAPVHSSAFRFAAEPLELAGASIAAGDAVLVGLAAASRDPGHYADADRFDLRRSGPAHLAFGHGPHHCLGAPLARVEAEVALRCFLTRFPTVAFATDPATLTWRGSTLLRGLTDLPLRLGRRGGG